MKFQSMFLAVSAVLAAAPAFARPVQGTYLGTCAAYYAGTAAAPCQMTMVVDGANGITIPGNANCISPTNFTGVYFDGETVELRAGGWNAQPQGQTLSLDFQQRHGRWSAAGSGGGIQDQKWSYRCSFAQQ